MKSAFAQRWITVLTVLLVCGAMSKLQAQCISSFPYTESFEASSAGWTATGNASDWAWGTPAKPVINKAATGTKCWITGGLSKTSYNNGENSWVESPCFDFSALQHPYIKFNIWWETENKYDGASFQYSTNGGTTWTTLGSNADYTACPSSNWFNTAGISVLGTHGWSGNIQPTAACSGGAGGGSGGWKLAQHNLQALAGKSNVRLRFTFGAGNVCNGYDGFAFDDIWIGEAPANDAGFNYTCTNATTVSFFPATTACTATFAWDFGDPASGTANTSAQKLATHTFSDKGLYTISLTVTTPGSAPVTSTKQVRILELSISQTGVLKCFGDKTASLQAQVSPSGNYTFQWNTTPQQTTATITGLGAGTYSATVSGTDACSATDNVTITEPAKLAHQSTFTDPQCGFPNGTAGAQFNGGTTPYTYQWTGTTGTTNVATALPAGNYVLTATDANNCIDTAKFTLVNRADLAISLGNDTTVCPGEKVTLTPGVFSSYKWQDGTTTPSYTVTTSGTYTVTVIAANGCTATDAITVTVDCRDLYFPSGFTPDNDGNNDRFGPLGNLGAIQSYSLHIYGRWGQLVFSSTNPSVKWDGKVGGFNAGTQVYVWVAKYRLLGQKEPITRKGTITLLR